MVCLGILSRRGQRPVGDRADCRPWARAPMVDDVGATSGPLGDGTAPQLVARITRATFAWGELTQTNADMPAVPRGMSAMLGVKHRCIAWSLRNASPVGSVLIGP